MLSVPGWPKWKSWLEGWEDYSDATTRVAAVSMNGLLGEPKRVLEAIDGWCERAAAAKADLVLFPELVIHGHCTPNTWELAEPVPDGPSVRRLSELARRHRLVLAAGLSEKEHDIVYNTLVLVGPAGYIGKQRKLHLSRDEVNYYKGGRDILVFDVGRCKVGTVICYDNQFPEAGPCASVAPGRRSADAPRRPFQALGRYTGKRGGGAGVTPTISSPSTPCVLARTPASLSWSARPGGREPWTAIPRTTRISPTTPARPSSGDLTGASWRAPSRSASRRR